MSLSVKIPDPPALGAQNLPEYDDIDSVGVEDYRREELEAFLEDGAWADAFEEWAAPTDLIEEEYAVAEDLSLIREFDFWDMNRVGR